MTSRQSGLCVALFALLIGVLASSASRAEDFFETLFGPPAPGSADVVDVEGGSFTIESDPSSNGPGDAQTVLRGPVTRVPGEAVRVAPGEAMDACASSAGKLGVERVVEIDATHGPQFGNEQNGSESFLDDKEVVLTFDDGPTRSHTRTVLDALAAECTKATFFMVGRMAVADPGMVHEVAAAGHTIGAHTWSHKNLGATSAQRAEDDFETGISAVTAAYGAPIAPFFRFPYLSANRSIERHAEVRGIATFWVDIDSKDYMSRDPKRLIGRVMAQLQAKGKGIILLHDIQVSTARGIAGLLKALREHGYKVVHVVPKSPATTVEKYDDAAEKLLAARSKGPVPVSERAVTAAAGAHEAAPTARRRAATHKRGTKPGQRPSASAYPTAGPSRVVSQADEERPWQKTIFDF